MATPTGRSRNDALHDDDYFMAVAQLTAKRSRDPNTQVGACIVKDGEIVSVGYNDILVDLGDDLWKMPFKNLFVSYAVTNAIVKARPEDLKGATVYTTLFPSDKCAINMIQSGIVRLVYTYKDPKYNDEPWFKASVAMIEETLTQKKFVPKKTVIGFDFQPFVPEALPQQQQQQLRIE